MTIAIIAALEEETAYFLQKLEQPEAFKIHGQPCSNGLLNKQPVVIALSGIGKVNAAAMTATLIERFSPTCIINSGCAGGVKPSVKIGDVVIGTDLIQHDFDLSVFGHDLGKVPNVGKSIASDSKVVSILANQARNVFNTHLGTIASGDQFMTDNERLPVLGSEIYAVEMEGAAIAQVAFLNDTPFAVIRAISDRADSKATTDFPQFVAAVSIKSARVIEATISDLSSI